MLEGEKIEISDWVIISDQKLSGFGGFIKKHDPLDNQFLICVTTRPDGLPCLAPGKQHYWVDRENLIKEEIIFDEVEILNMLDLALDTKDEQWFEELSAQLPSGNAYL